VYIFLTSTDEVPIGIIGSQFLEGTSLDEINPLGNLELTGTLKIGSIGLDESYDFHKRMLVYIKANPKKITRAKPPKVSFFLAPLHVY
jgi:hypothetical protein